MATDQKTVDYIAEQMAGAGEIRTRKMFGEYGLYCNDKIIALICDDLLYLKISETVREVLREVNESPAYPGSKPYFHIDPEYWDDAEYMSELAFKTAAEMPAPKKK